MLINNYIELPDVAIAKFEQLYDIMINSTVNVTAIKEKDDYYIKHILDSIYFFSTQENLPIINSIVDIGSGGGFPGIPLAIYYPNAKITLVESIAKKCKYLHDVVTLLKLNNIDIINDRAEHIKNRTFDLITARAVGTVAEVYSFTKHLASKSSSWLMYKGERVHDELADMVTTLNYKGIKSEIMRVDAPFTRSYLYLHY